LRVELLMPMNQSIKVLQNVTMNGTLGHCVIMFLARIQTERAWFGARSGYLVKRMACAEI